LTDPVSLLVCEEVYTHLGAQRVAEARRLAQHRQAVMAVIPKGEGEGEGEGLDGLGVDTDSLSLSAGRERESDYEGKGDTPTAQDAQDAEMSPEFPSL
ncbi:hypothetical protein KIPB_015930, partial [Kipferlia bialata]